MSPVGKAVWFIESHFATDITLDDIADSAGVSRYYMTRAFGDVTGAFGDALCLGPTLDGGSAIPGKRRAGHPRRGVGCASHEAFTRAFREQFGVTPEAVRDQGHLADINLLDTIKMEESIRTSVLVFEEYDMPGVTMRNSIATGGGAKTAWFKDTEGNILAISQRL